jgi:hypothetical protein
VPRRSTLALDSMGSEIAVPVFGPIVLICTIALVIVAISGRRRVVSTASILGLGRTRLALGYLGALVASVPVAIWMAWDDAKFKVGNHYITAEAAAKYQPGWSLTFYFILAPIAMVLITVLGLPLLALLRRVRLASIVGVLAASLAIAVILSYWMDSVSFEDLAIFETVTAGFVLAARLPWIRSPKLPPSESLGGAANPE